MKFFDKQNAVRELRNGFIAGIALLLPIVVTVFVIHLLATKVGEPAARFLLKMFYPDVTLRGTAIVYAINLASTVVVFVAVTALGFFSRYVIGKWVLGLGERLITAVPVVNVVYSTVKQIVDTFSEQQKAIFQKTVLVEYPRNGMYAIGFLTSDSKGEVQERTGKVVVNVFVPTTPNPTSGFLLMVPRDDVVDLEMSISEGMKLIISGGAVTPPFPRLPLVTAAEKRAGRSGKTDPESNAEAPLIPEPATRSATDGVAPPTSVLPQLLPGQPNA